MKNKEPLIKKQVNTSGIYPVEYKVLVKMEEVEKMTDAGIWLVDVEKDEMSQTEAEIVAVGAIAFTDPDWLDYPKVGDKVLIDRYAGHYLDGKDGKKYRLINDKEIGAIIK
jgi:co-chaperonin GroES (HSP10)